MTVLAIIIMVLYQWMVIDQAATIGRQITELQDARDLIAVKDAYIAELEVRLETKYQRDVTVTAYTARVAECDIDPGNTAMMTKPVPGRTVAVSRDLFDDGWTFGRSVYIAGFGVYVIEDLMAARHTEAIDVLVGSVRDARRIGRGSRRAVLIASR
jgi:3D (Asp-Asp-Asp) domain-containing protein